MWDNPRHILYFGLPWADEGKTVKKWKGVRVGDPKIRGKLEPREHRLYALFTASIFIFEPTIRLAELAHHPTT